MAIQNPPVTLDELAAALGRDREYIKRNWKKLHQKHGLPLKLSLGWLWPRSATEAWMIGYNEEEPTPDAPAPIAAIAANQNAALAARYAGGHA